MVKLLYPAEGRKHALSEDTSWREFGERTKKAIRVGGQCQYMNQESPASS
jgi:hypothetical protein